MARSFVWLSGSCILPRMTGEDDERSFASLRMTEGKESYFSLTPTTRIRPSGICL